MAKPGGRAGSDPGVAVALMACGLAVASAALWGSNTVVGRLAVNEVPPVAMTFWRTTIVVLTLLPFTYRELLDTRAKLQGHVMALVGLALVGPVSLNILVYYGLTSSLALNASLYNSATPVAIVVAAWLIIRERINLRIGAGMLLAMIGVVAIAVRGSVEVLLAIDIGVGDPLIIAGLLCWAVYSVLLRRRRDGLSDAAFLTVIMAASSVAVLPFYIASGATFELSPRNLFLIVFSGAVISVFANLCWIRSINLIGPNRAAQFHNLIPVFGTALAVTILDEKLHPYHAAGFAAILLGVYLATHSGAYSRAAVR